MAVAVALVVMLMLSSLDAADAQSELLTTAELDAAQAKWKANGPNDYQYSAQEIHTAARVSAVYTVENGTLTRITHPSEVSVPSGPTIDEIFAELRTALAGGHRVYAQFDDSDGHPTGYQVSLVKSGVVTSTRYGWTIHGLLPTTTPLLCGKYPATMFGTIGDDILRGSAYGDVIVALDGNDKVEGDSGDDYLCGGPGADQIAGEFVGPAATPTDKPANDVIYGGPGNDNLDGGWGDDLIYGEGGHDTMNGFTGNDTMYGQTGADAMSGGSGDDRLYGGPGYDRMFGSFGNDIIQGSGGNDQLWGEEGDDKLYGKSGDDFMRGGIGNDELYGAGGNDTGYGGSGNDRLQGAGGNDILYGDDGNDVLYGQNGGDALAGGSGVDVLYGAAGNDILTGGPGADNLQGAAGDDDLDGGDDNDVLFGQAGDDNLNGGANNNSCFQGAGSGNRVNCTSAPLDIDDVWTLTGGTFQGLPIGTLSASDAVTTLTITGGSITGFRDCNTYVGPVFRDGATFIVGTMQSTLVACAVNTPGDYFGALDDVHTIELDSSATPTRLTLIGPSATLVFSPSADVG